MDQGKDHRVQIPDNDVNRYSRAPIKTLYTYTINIIIIILKVISESDSSY